LEPLCSFPVLYSCITFLILFIILWVSGTHPN
jgi:hypothetical protein